MRRSNWEWCRAGQNRSGQEMGELTGSGTGLYLGTVCESMSPMSPLLLWLWLILRLCQSLRSLRLSLGQCRRAAPCLLPSWSSGRGQGRPLGRHHCCSLLRKCLHGGVGVPPSATRLPSPIQLAEELRHVGLMEGRVGVDSEATSYCSCSVLGKMLVEEV